MLELVAGTEFSKPESVKYLQLRRSRKEFVYIHGACVTKKISLRHTGKMINSKTTSPTMLCYQEIMNDCRAARSCSNYTRLSLFINPQEVWYISQVSYLFPRSSGRLLANQKLGQSFRAPGSWTSSPKPHAGSWPLYTLTVPFSGAS